MSGTQKKKRRPSLFIESLMFDLTEHLCILIMPFFRGCTNHQTRSLTRPGLNFETSKGCYPRHVVNLLLCSLLVNLCMDSCFGIVSELANKFS
uniref:Putative ovule protein n=1 Tax=Solanum chacoense TaxID=4108 RepID=A0A0V0GZB6_SOLCH